jgi:hypothetical protein
LRKGTEAKNLGFDLNSIRTGDGQADGNMDIRRASDTIGNRR